MPHERFLDAENVMQNRTLNLEPKNAVLLDSRNVKGNNRGFGEPEIALRQTTSQTPSGSRRFGKGLTGKESQRNYLENGQLHRR